MKRKLKRILSFFLAFLIVVSGNTGYVFADEVHEEEVKGEYQVILNDVDMASYVYDESRVISTDSNSITLVYQEGETVNFSLQVGEGYEIESIKVVNTLDQEVLNSADGNCTFTMPLDNIFVNVLLKEVIEESTEEVQVQQVSEGEIQQEETQTMELEAEDKVEVEDLLEDGIKESDVLGIGGDEGIIIPVISNSILRGLSGTAYISTGDSLSYDGVGFGNGIGWGSRYFNLHINGEVHIAYCLEPTTTYPISGDYAYQEVTSNLGLTKALYFAHGGPGSSEYIETLGLDGPAQYILSHVVCAYFYGDPDWSFGLNSTGITYANNFISWLNGVILPSPLLTMSDSSLTSSASGSSQKTNTVTLNGDSSNSVKVALQNGVELHNVTKGSVSTGTVTINGGDTFYLEAPLRLTGTWDSGDLYGSITTKFAPLLFKTFDSVQTLGSWVFDPTDPVSFSVKWLDTGNIEIIKTSEDGIVSGLKFRVTGDNVDKTVTTGSDGTIEIENLIVGTYTITEVSTPNRYIEPKSQTVTVEVGKTTTVTFENVLKRGDLQVTKSSEDGLISGVKFRLYGTSLSGIKVDEYATTNSNGVATFSDILISGSEKYTLEEVDTAVRYVIPDSQEVAVNWNEVTKASVSNILKKFRVSVAKIDGETGTAQGAATLEGAVYGIYNDGKLVDEYTTDENGEFVTSYYICGAAWTLKEITPSEGYLLDTTEYSIGAEPENFVIELNPLTEDVKEDIIRGDLKGVKISDGDMKRMSGVPFKITSVTTGENHVVVTDENGQFDTSSSWNLHSQDTNRGETAYDGIWFGELSALDDNRGALPYDTYMIEELPCEANEGMTLFEPFQVNVSRNLVTVDLGTITNDYVPQPEIGTTATDKETGSHNGYISDTTTIVDVVDYINLTVGKEYTLKGILMDKETGEAYLDDGKEVAAELTFTPEKANGSVEVEFVIKNGDALRGKTVVVFEYLYCDEKEVTVHADIEDKGQTVTFPEPEIGTTAKDKATGTNTGMIKEEVVIIDTVSYSGLTPGKEYILKGILMDKETGKAYLDDGKEVAAELTFTPEKANGSVEVEFVIKNGDALRGKTVVVFEDVYYDGFLVATHADIEDAGQTVVFKELPKDSNGTIKTSMPQSTRSGSIVKTGDSSQVIFIILALITSGVIISIYVYKKKRIKE